MAELNNKLNLLNEELDEESQKYLQEKLEEWKESVVNQLTEQSEQETQAKLEELERESEAYREQLKEEFTEKMLEGINELKESIRAEVTAEVIKNNPELKIFEEVKEKIAPLVSENYRDNTYEDTIMTLSNELDAVKRELELREGAETLANLLAPYNKTTRDVVLALIKEGSPEEVSEQFYSILEAVTSEKDDDSEDDDEDSKEKESKDDNSEDDDSDNDDEDDDDSEDDDEDDEDTQKESFEEDSYITEGYEGFDAEAKKSENRYSSLYAIKKYSK